MGVPQFTTPSFTLEMTEEGLDLTTQARNVYVTFTSGNYELTKTGEDLVIGEKTIGILLSQDETGNFKTGNVKIQANWTTISGRRAGTDVVTYEITEQLLRRVIE